VLPMLTLYGQTKKFAEISYAERAPMLFSLILSVLRSSKAIYDDLNFFIENGPWCMSKVTY
jgi:hypothetical protein